MQLGILFETGAVISWEKYELDEDEWYFTLLDDGNLREVQGTTSDVERYPVIARIRITDLIDQYYLLDFRVNDAYRGKKMARVLLEQIIARFGHKQLSLHAGVSNDSGLTQEELVQFYERLGFSVQGPGRMWGCRMVRHPLKG